MCITELFTMGKIAAMLPVVSSRIAHESFAVLDSKASTGWTWPLSLT